MTSIAKTRPIAYCIYIFNNLVGLKKSHFIYSTSLVDIFTIKLKTKKLKNYIPVEPKPLFLLSVDSKQQTCLNDIFSFLWRKN